MGQIPRSHIPASGTGMDDMPTESGENTIVNSVKNSSTKAKVVGGNTIREYFTQKQEDPVVRNAAVRNTVDEVGTDGLYEAASNIRQIREASGECVVVRKWCNKHNQEATRRSWNKKVWARNKKTGLYKYVTRKMSVLCCAMNMGTLLGTMAQVDGAGVNIESCTEVVE